MSSPLNQGEFGPGKYDDVTNFVRKITGGQVIVVVIGGCYGDGFECQLTAETMLLMPTLLRALAESIEHGAGPIPGGNG